VTVSPAPRDVVVVGASQAGVAAAHTLRELGYDGRLVLVGDEPHPPYERPPLSKDVLTGAAPVEATALRPPAWYVEQQVELRLGQRAVRVDDDGVTLATGERLPADRVLLTTGGRARRLRDVPEHDRVLTLRGRDDAERLRAFLRPGARLLVVGAGFLGSEVAASARSLGVEVVLLEALAAPLTRVVGPVVGAALARLHVEHGVDLRLGTAVATVTPRADGVIVRTASGETVDGDAVLVALGMVPNDEIAVASGIRVADGILVDGRCGTSRQHVFAAGDVARHDHRLYGAAVRVEHYDNANQQGVAAAHAMLGRDVEYANPHWFWSDQYDHVLTYAGHAPHWDEVIVRGNLDAYDATVFYLLEGVLRGVLGVDRPREVKAGQRLIAAAARPPAAALADPAVDLRALARQLVAR
jgi:3-phenylpropionate/trans-cinnamate dioxygenase ferredoxin reductase subunit